MPSRTNNLSGAFLSWDAPLINKRKISMRNKELIALLQEQDPEAEVMIRTSDGEYEYDPVDVTYDEQIECVIIQEG